MADTGGLSAPQLNSTFGCLFLAGIFASVLWGVGCLQVWLYYEKHSKTDQRWLKAYIFLIWVFDLAHQVILVQTNYVYFVKGIADPTLLARFPKTFTFNAILTAIVDVMVQSIFVRRVWYISNKNIILGGILSILVLGQFIVTTIYFGQILTFTRLTQLTSVIRTELAINCISAFTDMSLAVVLIYFLWRGRTGFKRTDTIINRLVAYTICTSFITALWAIVALVSVAVTPDSLLYLLVDMTIPRLYLNCMLTSLNARSSIRGTVANDIGGLSIRFENLSSSTGENSNVSAGFFRKVTPGTRVIECNVDVVTESHSHQQQKFERSVHDPDTDIALTGFESV